MCKIRSCKGNIIPASASNADVNEHFHKQYMLRPRYELIATLNPQLGILAKAPRVAPQNGLRGGFSYLIKLKKLIIHVLFEFHKVLSEEPDKLYYLDTSSNIYPCKGG